MDVEGEFLGPAAAEGTDEWFEGVRLVVLEARELRLIWGGFADVDVEAGLVAVAREGGVAEFFAKLSPVQLRL